MALVVEDGTGLASANSYVALADFISYAAARLHRATVAAADDATRTAALITATQLIDTYIRFHGSRLTTTQALEWPRSGVTDRDGNTITGLPQRLLDATCELAAASLSEDRTAPDSKAGMTRLKADSLEIEWDAARKPVKAVMPSIVTALLSGLGRSNQGYCRDVGRS